MITDLQWHDWLGSLGVLMIAIRDGLESWGKITKEIFLLF